MTDKYLQQKLDAGTGGSIEALLALVEKWRRENQWGDRKRADELAALLARRDQPEPRHYELLFHDAEKEIPPEGDKRKLVWLEDFDGMSWWGIRVHITRNEWFNNNKPELARVRLWADLPPHAEILLAPTRRDAPQEQHEDDQARVAPTTPAPNKSLTAEPSPGAVTAAERTEKV